MAAKTTKEIRKIVLAAISLEYIEQSLDDTYGDGTESQVEASITPDQNIRIRRSNPLQEFIVEVKAI